MKSSYSDVCVCAVTSPSGVWDRPQSKSNLVYLASKYAIWWQATLSVYNLQLRNIGRAKCRPIVCPTNPTVGRKTVLGISASYVPAPLSFRRRNSTAVYKFWLELEFYVVYREPVTGPRSAQIAYWQSL